MAILDHPLFGTEAYGRIRNTILFFKRVANKNYKDPDPGERFHFTSKLSFPQPTTTSLSREQQKNLFAEGCVLWYSLTEDQKEALAPFSIALETPFNTFIRYYLWGIPLPSEGGHWGIFEIDLNGDLEPITETLFGQFFELDQNSNLMPTQPSENMSTCTSLFEIDINGDAEPITQTLNDQFFELDGSSDVMPKEV